MSAAFGACVAHRFLRGNPRGAQFGGRADIVCHMTPLYKARADRPFSARLARENGLGLGKVEKLSTLRKRAFHERPPARLFSRQAAGVEGRDLEGIADHAADAPGRECQSS